ncbi:MAG: SusC/RagA family TonB-linked outer membrane protein [Bacteroidota bacterium]
MRITLYNFRKFGILFLFFILSSGLSAQNINVEGVVTDNSDGSTMVGVSILIKGTQKATVTDINGKYKIESPLGGILVFSFVGYKTNEVIANKSVINVSLYPSVKMLEEVIAIGYSTQKKTDKTGAVSNIKASELNGGSLTDPIQALQGKAAGVMVSKKGGDPNAGFSVRIRGASGYLASTEPLYVIDGIPGADPTLVSNEDIESYNILKDAASTAIYGSRGSNGVIIITTKKGRNLGGKNSDMNISQINFSSQLSIENIAKKLSLLSATEMRAFAQKLSQTTGRPVDSIFVDGGANTDWQNAIYRTGISKSNNLSFSGGNTKSFYYVSLTNSNWTGVMKGTDKERNIARINLNHSAIDDRLTFALNLTSAFENNSYENYGGWGNEDIIYQAITRNPTDPIYKADGTFDKTSRVFNYINPVSIIDNVENKRDLQNFQGNLRTDFKILEGLSASLNLGYMNNVQKFSYFRPSGLYLPDLGAGEKREENNTQKIIEFTTSYEKIFNKIHTINLLGGYTWQENENFGFFAKGVDAQSDHIGSSNLAIFNQVNYGDIGSWRAKSNLIGFFGRAQYNLNQKYYLSASLRRDGSSRFGSNNKWGMFPTFALGWSMEKESFLKDIQWLNQLKLRLSYGISGNQEIGDYHSVVVWTPTGKATNPETGKEVITFGPAWNANPDLKWEQTAELNIGLDFAVFDSKISGSLEVYKKNTTDLLGEYSVPVPPNLASTTFANSGELENKGIELFLQAYPISKKNVVWKTSFNISHNQTTIISLGKYFNSVDGVRKEGYISGRGLVGEEYYLIGMMEGQPFGAFYLPTYVTLKDGKFIYKSKTGGFTENLSEAQRSIVGNATPDLEIGWSNSITFFKNWNLDFSFRAMIGNHVYNATQMFLDNPGNLPDLNANSAAIDWYNKGRTSGASIADFYVENASFLRLDYVSISYDFKFNKTNILKKLNVFASSNNLFTITGYSGIDPETTISGLSFGIDQYNVYPKTRTFTFGIKGTF